jgi:hypothetical protein
MCDDNESPTKKKKKKKKRNNNLVPRTETTKRNFLSLSLLLTEAGLLTISAKRNHCFHDGSHSASEETKSMLWKQKLALTSPTCGGRSVGIVNW